MNDNAADYVATHPRGEKVTIEMTARDAERIRRFLDVVMESQKLKYPPSMMRKLSRIGRQVSKAINAPWRW